MMMIFSGGYMAVFLLFALMHLNAYRLRDVLELSPLERYDTVDNVRESLLNVGIGALSVLLTAFGGPFGPLWGGLTYWLVGPALYANGVFSGRVRTRLQARLAAE